MTMTAIFHDAVTVPAGQAVLIEIDKPFSDGLRASSTDPLVAIAAAVPSWLLPWAASDHGCALAVIGQRIGETLIDLGTDQPVHVSVTPA
jgi:hypothetical protein